MKLRKDTRKYLMAVLLLVGVGFATYYLLLADKSVSADSTQTLRPVADGSYRQWTPSGRSSKEHYALVDESECNGTTDYVYTNIIGNRDSYRVNLSSIPDGSTINSIEISFCASNNSGKKGNDISNKVSSLLPFYRFNGADSPYVAGYQYALLGTTPVERGGATYYGLSLIKDTSSTLEIGAVLTSGSGSLTEEGIGTKSSTGARLSRISAVITYTPPLQPLPPAPQAPSNLTAIIASAATSSAVRLDWNDNSNNEDGFSIERQDSATTTFRQISAVISDITTYTDSGLLPGTYAYRVKAYNSTGPSAYSNIATTTIP